MPDSDHLPASAGPATPAALITRIVSLPGIPSASGMEQVGEVLYVVGDDSPYLYRLDRQYRPLPPIELFGTAHFGTGRIPKHLKPDLEALTKLQLQGQPHLLAIGSGSAPARDVAYLVQLPEQGEPQVKAISMTGFYTHLQQHLQRLKGGPLNLEGITATPDAVHLLQRGVGEQPNFLITVAMADFRLVLSLQDQQPEVQLRELPRPLLRHVKAGYSGLTYFDDYLFLTASVEDTADPVLDGEVLGSFAGYMAGKDAPLQLHQLTNAQGQVPPIKVESVLVLEQLQQNVFKAIGVTDNDLGQSELVEMELRVE